MYHPMAIVVLGGARVCDMYTVAIYSSTAGSVMSKDSNVKGSNVLNGSTGSNWSLTPIIS